MIMAVNPVWVACCQLAPRINDAQHNRALTEVAIRQAAGHGAQIVVLPELIQSGYVFRDRAEALSNAETQDGPTIGLWKALAQELNLVIVGGFCERLSEESVANSAVIISAQGLLAVYRKVHLWDREHLIFEPGTKPPPVVDTIFGRLSVMICYDLEFPEWVRLPALQGAELLCVPVNWPDAPRPSGERPAEVTKVQASAAVNRMFIAACDRCGQERGVDWVGGSLIADANGYRVSNALTGLEPGIIFTGIDLNEAHNKRVSEHSDVHRDRRPDLYGSLVDRQPVHTDTKTHISHINMKDENGSGQSLPPPLYQFAVDNEMLRFPSIATMMRLPLIADTTRLDVGFVGVGLDLGTSNRSGTRFGPQQIRNKSVLLRPYNMATRAAPFDTLRVADLGDIAINPYNLLDSVARIEQGYAPIVAGDCRPITLGGDHTITLPILRALHRRHGPIGLIYIGAHADVNDNMFDEKVAHGMTFRRAMEEGLLDPSRVVQIGLRGTGYRVEDFDWCRKQGFRVVQVEECWGKSLASLMTEVREQLSAGPVYFTLDIDGIDPAFAPGTGAPEIAGLTVPQALEVIRGAWGLDLIGADVVEVSPPYDPHGITALLGANLAYELLCVMPGVVRRP